MIANISYEKARQLAIDRAGWNPYESGLAVTDAKEILEHLGVKCVLHDQTESTKWSGLPDLALITVEHGLGIPHAVVFSRTKSGKEFIYDNQYSRPVSRNEHTRDSLYPHGYELDTNAYYLEIIE